MSSATAAPTQLAAPPTFLATTVGKKMVMAASGVVLFGFVFVHMLGNLQLYQGREAINAYGAFLHGFLHGAGIWVFRVVLLAAVAGHIWAAFSLWIINNRARPVGYRVWKAQDSSYASRTMKWSGPIILLFVIAHLLHLTTGQALPGGLAMVPGQPHMVDVYANVVTLFTNAPAAIFYIVANLLLGIHLGHGVWSMLQTLGLNHPRYNGLRGGAATAFAAIVTAVNVSFPVAVLAGFVK